MYPYWLLRLFISCASTGYDWSAASDGLLWGLGGLIPFGVLGSNSARLKADLS